MGKQGKEWDHDRQQVHTGDRDLYRRGKARAADQPAAAGGIFRINRKSGRSDHPDVGISVEHGGGDDIKKGGEER